MLRVGLTGGIGAGKSTASAVLDELGAIIIDADQIAREVVAPGTPGLERLVEAFGRDILLDDGSLNRPALAAKAFKDDESRLRLNSIVHPLVGQRTAELTESAADDAILVHDIPLLIENAIGPTCNLVLVVHAEVEQRIERLTGMRGMPEEDARARIAAQATDEQRRAAADVWLDNTGEPHELEEQVRKVWEARLVPFERNLRERRPASASLELHQPDSDSEAAGARVVARLRFLAGELAQRVDYIGPSSGPGPLATDVLDIQITVASMEVADELAPKLENGGFPRVPNLTSDSSLAGTDASERPKRLHASADPGRPANVYVLREGG
ncbi:dephospho-CoA kinase [Hoyosella subflava]|uniref:Dephospho-CoA kinase n=1 Tax=Hoyosella subflava (strain DSM 45089 / JCM 17490 / NBRC 109087 / DQS3-9A1) TaxID=443218 RepID=F6EHZ1_HOYSD|nr:dephospho-CoA kinase [Hoyosella subflava]AEF39940.1 putative dephospho-CoA kinase [Hoyosella subflava DQS3-9A1]